MFELIIATILFFCILNTINIICDGVIHLVTKFLNNVKKYNFCRYALLLSISILILSFTFRKKQECSENEEYYICVKSGLSPIYTNTMKTVSIIILLSIGLM